MRELLGGTEENSFPETRAVALPSKQINDFWPTGPQIFDCLRHPFYLLMLCVEVLVPEFLKATQL